MNSINSSLQVNPFQIHMNHLQENRICSLCWEVLNNPLDEPMRKKLHAVLVKSEVNHSVYLKLIGQALGLIIRSSCDEDTVGLDDEEMVIDYQKELAVLDMLTHEPDGGYFLLKCAEFLSLGGASDLVCCIKAIKNQPIEIHHPNELLKIFLQIHPSDRVDVLTEVFAVKEQWRISLDSEAIKYRLLIGIGAIPPEKRETVLTLLPAYDSYLNACNILGGDINGIIVAYLLYPMNETYDAVKLFTATLWYKLLDHSLPVFTLTHLARFVQTLGVPGYHPLRMLGQIMRLAETEEPARSTGIHAKLKEHFAHLSTYRCPFEEMELKRKGEDGPGSYVKKKLHL